MDGRVVMGCLKLGHKGCIIPGGSILECEECRVKIYITKASRALLEKHKGVAVCMECMSKMKIDKVGLPSEDQIKEMRKTAEERN